MPGPLLFLLIVLALPVQAAELFGVGLTGVPLRPLLREPALAFLLGVLAGLTVPFLLRSPARPPRLSAFEARLRRGLRSSPTVALFAASLLLVLFTVFGAGLDPESASASPDRSRPVWSWPYRPQISLWSLQTACVRRY